MDTQQDGTDHDEAITRFIGITGKWRRTSYQRKSFMTHFSTPGAEEDISKNILEACNWDVEMAVNMFCDSNFSASTLNSASARPRNNPEQAAAVEPMQT